MTTELAALRQRAVDLEAQLAAANKRAEDALRRIAAFTSATPSLSESGCGRLLAQIEHEALAAIDAVRSAK